MQSGAALSEIQARLEGPSGGSKREFPQFGSSILGSFPEGSGCLGPCIGDPMILGPYFGVLT